MIVYNEITWSSKNEGDNDCENCPRVKLVGDSKNTAHEEFFYNNQKIVNWNMTNPKRKFVVIGNDEQITWMIIKWPYQRLYTLLYIKTVASKK